jgi:hypothetical protein
MMRLSYPYVSEAGYRTDYIGQHHLKQICLMMLCMEVILRFSLICRFPTGLTR